MASRKHTTPRRPYTKADAVREQNRVIQQALRILESRARVPGILLRSLEAIGDWLRLRMGGYTREVFAVAWLDGDRRLIEFREIFLGTLNYTDVQVREVVKSALDCNASAAVLAHNHPSGRFHPSDGDVSITSELVTALNAVRVDVLDHFIITASAPPFSMASHDMVIGQLQAMRRRMIH